MKQMRIILIRVILHKFHQGTTRMRLLATTRFKPLTALLACSALFLSACSSGNNQADESVPDLPAETTASVAPGLVTVWSYRPETVVAPVLAAFTEATGIPTRHQILPGDEILAALPATQAPERPDLVLTVDTIRFEALKADGQLTPLPSSASAAVPPMLRDAESHWAGISWRVRGVVQRRDAASDLDWSDLPALAEAGRLCVRPGAHVYNRSLLAWQIPRLGEEEGLAWTEAVHGAPTVVNGGDRDQIMAVADGRCDVAIVNHYYLARMRLSEDASLREAGEQVLFGNPDQPLPLQPNISGIALVSNSPNPDGGLALARWMLDPANQGVYATPTAEFPASWPALDLALGEALDAFEAVQPEGPWPAELAPAIEAAERFFSATEPSTR